MIQKKTAFCASFFIVVLNLLDALTTWYALKNNISKEYNPSMVYIINFFGLNGAMIFKIVLVTLISFWAYSEISKTYKKYQTCISKQKKKAHYDNVVYFSAICGAVFMLLYVVVGNTLVIFGIIKPA